VICRAWRPRPDSNQQEAVDRIGELLIPGSSLVVSDTGLGLETGRRTEFIVLTL
jgi:hypothetical protein